MNARRSDGSIAHILQLAVIAFAVTAAVHDEPAHADRARRTVVRGDVTFVHRGDRMIIRASDGSIINHVSFNILPWETVRFIQPHDLARVLNRITGPEPTHIQGRLLANGQVYLVNPAGVAFSGDAVVNVGSLYAAAGSISNEDFLAGRNHFTDLSGSVVNQGAIRADQIHLLGEHVANHGLLQSGGGVITMVAGNDVILKRHGERISVKVDGRQITGQSQPYAGSTAPDTLATAGVENTGTIVNPGGQVVFGAGDMYALAIHNTGTVRARGGDITLATTDGLVHNAGTLNVSVDEGRAGSVTVQGPSVLNEGVIRASAHNGQAGEIEITSQHHTFLTETSRLAAGGRTGSARGGNVLVHSYDGLTVFADHATIDISGGALGGRGGFAEVSGSTLVFNGDVAMRAKQGLRHGEVLLDPIDLTIDDVGGDDSFLLDGTFEFGEGPVESFIAASTIEALDGTVHLQADGTIFVDTALTLDGQNLLFEAKDSIFVNAPITGANDLTFVADFDLSGEGWIRLHAPISILGDAELIGTDVFFRNAQITSVGTQRYVAQVWIATTTALAASQVTFADAVDAKPVTMELPRFVINGDAEFQGAVGGRRPLRSLRVNGATTIGGGLVRTDEQQRYFGPVKLTSDLQLHSRRDDTIQLGGRTRSAGGAHSLLVTTAGAIRFDDHVGRNGALGDITLEQMAPAGNSVRFAGDVNAASLFVDRPARLVEDVEMNIDMSAAFTDVIHGQGHDLAINAHQTIFSAALENIGRLETDRRGTTHLGGNVTAVSANLRDAVRLDGDVTMLVDEFANFGSTLDSDAALASLILGAGKSVRFGGDVGADNPLGGLLVATGLASDVDSNFVLVDGNLIRADGSIIFTQGGRAIPSFVATVAATGDLEIVSENDDVFFGLNEKVTALGNLSLRAPNGTLVVGDLNAFGFIHLESPDIRIWAREPGLRRTPSGRLIQDRGVDIIAGGSITAATPPPLGDGPASRIRADQFRVGPPPGSGSPKITLLGSGPAPIVIPFLGQRLGDGPLGQALADQFTRGALPGFGRSQFTFGSLILDLATATSGNALATAIVDPQPRVRREVDRSAFAVRAMERMAIYLRELDSTELAIAPSGVQMYLDTPGGGLQRDTPLTTTTNRLSREAVLDCIDRYAALFTSPGSDYTSGLEPVDQTAHIRATLSQAWTAYGTSTSPDDFRTFVAQSSEHQDASMYLEQLDGLFQQLSGSGVTPRELRASLDGVLGPLTPTTMEQSVLETSIGAL